MQNKSIALAAILKNLHYAALDEETPRETPAKELTDFLDALEAEGFSRREICAVYVTASMLSVNLYRDFYFTLDSLPMNQQFEWDVEKAALPIEV